MSRRPPSVAVIGCGAISERFHLPALARIDGACERAVLVDVRPDRAERLAEAFGVSAVARDYGEVLGDVDGAVVAVPPRLHHDVVMTCVGRGVHVLCEKPLATSAEEARRMVEAASCAGVHVGVNHTRRLYPASRKIRSLVEERAFGELERIEFELGEVFDWPAAGDSYFGRSAGGRGVLQDIGAHVVDLLCWWLDARPEVVAYRDDSLGGGEAVADLELRHQDLPIHVRLSWLSRLSNRFEIRGASMSAIGKVYEWDRINIERPGERRRTVRLRPRRTERDFADAMIRNFLETARDGAIPLVPASSVLDSIAVIDRCYDRRRRFALPWLELDADSLRRKGGV